MAYNSFNKEDNSELLQLSQFFKDKDITDLVLDLRYNAGGEMECVQLLADILVPADKLNSPFASLEYSQKRKYKDHELTLDSKLFARRCEPKSIESVCSDKQYNCCCFGNAH